MKILFFVRRFAPEVGGVETHVEEVSERLREMGHEVTVVAEKASGSPLSSSAKDLDGDINSAVYRIPVGSSERGRKFLVWRWLWKHRKLLREADVIHAHDVFYWYMPFRLLYPRKKVFTTFHGYETVYPPRENAIRIRRLSARLSTGTIAVGKFIEKWYGTCADAITYGGVSESVLKISKHVQASDTLNIVFVGRMENDTSGTKYMELLELLKKNKIVYSFIGLGEGKLRERFGEYGETPGMVSNVSEFLEKSDVVFASSYLSILEALALGKMVVSFYDNPLKKDYLEMTPFAKWIIIEESVDEAYKRIKQAIFNPNRLQKTLGEAQEWARTQTWDEVTKLYLKLYKR